MIEIATLTRYKVLIVVTAAAFVPLLGAAPAIDVKDIWLKRNCLDDGSADRPLVGKRFEACLRKQIEGLPPLDPKRRDFFGERYEPRRYVECRLSPENRNNSACNVYILRRRDWPEYWPPNAVRIKWPEAPIESVYKPGMNAKQYWEALCKAEAGEFIYRSVQGVDGLLMIRPRGSETDMAMQDKYVIEDAYGLHEFAFGDGDPRPGRRIFRLQEKNYSFVESGIADTQRGFVWIRHSIDVRKLKQLLGLPPEKWEESDFAAVAEIPQPRSRYGLTWRGIHRTQDTELGISGGELAIVNLESGEILALRRGFALDGYAARGNREQHSWLGSWGCPVMRREPKTLREFLNKTLEPKVLVR